MADQHTQVAAYAFFSVQLRMSCIIKRNRLMTTVCAGNLTTSTTDAAISFKLRENHRVALQNVCRLAQGIQAQADNFLHAAEILFCQIQIQAGLQIVDDPVTVLHHRRGNLKGGCAHQEKLHRILPAFDASHAAQMHPLQLLVLPHLRNKPQRNGLHRVSAVSAHSALSADSGRRNVRMQIDPDD